LDYLELQGIKSKFTTNSCDFKDTILVTVNAHYEELNNFINEVYEGSVKVDLIKVEDF